MESNPWHMTSRFAFGIWRRISWVTSARKRLFLSFSIYSLLFGSLAYTPPKMDEVLALFRAIRGTNNAQRAEATEVLRNLHHQPGTISLLYPCLLAAFIFIWATPVVICAENVWRITEVSKERNIDYFRLVIFFSMVGFSTVLLQIFLESSLDTDTRQISFLDKPFYSALWSLSGWFLFSLTKMSLFLSCIAMNNLQWRGIGWTLKPTHGRSEFKRVMQAPLV